MKVLLASAALAAFASTDENDRLFPKPYARRMDDISRPAKDPEFISFAALQRVDKSAHAFVGKVRAAGVESLSPFFGFQPACAGVYRSPFFGCKSDTARAEISSPMTEWDLRMLVAAESKRLRRSEKRQAAARRARVTKALGSPVTARDRFEAKEAARRARAGAGAGVGR